MCSYTRCVVINYTPSAARNHENIVLGFPLLISVVIHEYDFYLEQILFWEIMNLKNIVNEHVRDIF